MLENIRQICQHSSKVERFENMYARENFFVLEDQYLFCPQKPCQCPISQELPEVSLKQQNRSIVIKVIAKCFKQTVIQSSSSNTIYNLKLTMNSSHFSEKQGKFLMREPVDEEYNEQPLPLEFHFSE